MLPGIGKAELIKGRAEVLGMTCEFCEKALEKRLKTIPGVEGARADLAKGYAEFTFKKGTVLDLDRIATAVKDGGLTLEKVHVTARGHIVNQRGRKALKVSGTDQVLLLLEGPRTGSPETGATVTVTGQVEKTADGQQIVLAVQAVTGEEAR